MSLLDNKPMTILIAVNVVALMVIFWLIGLLMGRDSQPVQAVTQPMQQAAPIIQTAPVMNQPAPILTAPAAQAIAASTSSPVPSMQDSLQERAADIVGNMTIAEAEAAQAFVEPEPDPEPVIIERVTTIDVFYDGNIAQIEKTDDSGNRTISISNNLKEVQKLSEEDASYLAQYRQMKSGKIGHMQITQVTQEEAQNITAAETSVITEEPVDYFNKVEVSAQAPRPSSSLASRVAMLVNAESSADRRRKQKAQERAEQQKFISAIEDESAERRNETRTIKVRGGDSLWKIAQRAYGSGFEFQRIYAANPHLKNPDMIRVGDTLRVPL